MRKHIFNAGPCVLADSVRENTAKAVLELENTGMSILEVSHRSKDFEAVINETIDLFKEILEIPDGYSVLFLGGGASLQFAMIPFNFLNKKAAYLNTGTWAKGAIKEAKLFGEVDVVATPKTRILAISQRVTRSRRMLIISISQRITRLWVPKS
jgi:phosphoserine aminotransferase